MVVPNCFVRFFGSLFRYFTYMGSFGGSNDQFFGGCFTLFHAVLTFILVEGQSDGLSNCFLDLIAQFFDILHIWGFRGSITYF